MNKKIISIGYSWKCSNLDLLAPIEKEGLLVLFDDNTTTFFPYENNNGINTVNLDAYEFASENEKRLFINRKGAVLEGDKIVIFKGRKMKGEIKTIDKFFRYEVKNTYGHVYVNYAIFTDGTKCNLQNCKPLLPENVNFFYDISDCGSIKGHNILNIGGRL